MKKKITYFYVYVYLLIIKKKKKVQESIMLKFCIYKELELSKLEYCVAWNSSLISSSSMWHFFNKKININTSVFYETRVFKTRFTQQNRVSWTRVSKKWYFATYFANSSILLIISVISGKWPILPIIVSYLSSVGTGRLMGP